jgi:hypothetical protein
MTQTINGKQYDDQEMTCQDCGRPFTFTTGEQSFYDEKGFTPPKRCQPCRKANRQEKDRQRAERAMGDQPRTGKRGRR